MGMVTIVTATEADKKILDALKADIEKAMKDQDHVIVTNFEIEILQIEIEADSEIIVLSNE